jgi:hypothetical protein
MLNPWPGLSLSGAGCMLGTSKLNKPSFCSKRHQRARIEAVVGGRGLASLAGLGVKAARDKAWGGAVVGGRGLEPLTPCV